MDPIMLALLGVGGLAAWYFTRPKPAVQVIKGISQGAGNVPSGTPVSIAIPVKAPAALPPLPTPYKAPVGQNVASAATGHVPSALVLPSTNGILQMGAMIITPTGAANANVMTAKDVQNALNTLGYGPLTVDGIIGQQSIASIKKFQDAHNGAGKESGQYGQLSPNLSAALSDALVNLGTSATAAGPAASVAPAVTPSGAPVPTMRIGSSGASVVALQTNLNQLGAAPALTTDGKYGNLTATAVKAFQAHHSLTVDGVAGPQTQAAITLALQG